MATRKQKLKNRQAEENINAQVEYRLIQSIPNQKQKPIDYLQPKTQAQADFLKSLQTTNICIASGSSGSGKTTLAAFYAAKALLRHETPSITITRANETVGKTIGFLKGTVEEKMIPLINPILESIERFLGSDVYEYGINKKAIKMLPFEYIRGLSSRNILIVDEAQNLTKDDMITLVTRFEKGRLILLGDPDQNDLKQESGLVWLEHFIKRNNLDGFAFTKFTEDDCVRSKETKDFMLALKRERQLNSNETKLPTLLKG